MSKTLEVDDTSFDQVVLKSTIPVLVDFWAPWCGPCRMVSPIVEELAEEYGDKASFAKVNVDENQKMAARYGIRSIPTLLFFKEGKPMHQVIGFSPKKELKRQLDALLK